MKKLMLLLLILLIVLIACTEEKTIIAPDLEIDLNKDLQEMLDSEFDSYMVKYPNFIGGFAFQVLSNKGDYFIHKGLGDNITSEIHFRAASNTKTFTSAGILLLHQQGKLNVKSKITDLIPGTTELYIPETPAYDIPYKDDITIWQLLSHRAGVFDVTNDAIPANVQADVPYKGAYYLDYKMAENATHTFTFDELIGVVAVCSLSYFEPGEGYHYSNQGYSLLGKIIERVSGKSYKQFMIDEFVAPLGLTSTTFPDQGDDQIIPSPAVKSYIQLPDGNIDVTESNMSGNVAEGNLLTSPKDLSKFIRSLLKGELKLNLSTINNIMMDCRATGDVGAGGYGAGLMDMNNLGYGHNGAHEAFFSYMVSDPSIDFTIVIFTNSWNGLNGMESFIEQLRLLEKVCRKAKSVVIYN